MEYPGTHYGELELDVGSAGLNRGKPGNGRTNREKRCGHVIDYGYLVRTLAQLRLTLKYEMTYNWRSSPWLLI